MLAFDELNEIFGSPFLQLVKVPLDGSTILQCVTHASQFGVTSKFTEDTVCSSSRSLKKVVEEDWTHPLGYTATYWSPITLSTTEHQPLDWMGKWIEKSKWLSPFFDA